MLGILLQIKSLKNVYTFSNTCFLARSLKPIFKIQGFSAWPFPWPLGLRETPSFLREGEFNNFVLLQNLKVFFEVLSVIKCCFVLLFFLLPFRFGVGRGKSHFSEHENAQIKNITASQIKK